MKSLYPFRDNEPQVDSHVFIAPGVKAIGKVTLEKGVSIWYNTVLRGDVDRVVVKEYTNIQDGCVVHCDPGSPTIVGKYVTVGHGAILHGCVIGDYCLIGIGAIILNNVEIGEGSIIGAGALVLSGSKIPPFSVVMGAPAKVVRTLDPTTIEQRKEHALDYYKRSRIYVEDLKDVRS